VYFNKHRQFCYNSCLCVGMEYAHSPWMFMHYTVWVDASNPNVLAKPTYFLYLMVRASSAPRNFIWMLWVDGSLLMSANYYGSDFSNIVQHLQGENTNLETLERSCGELFLINPLQRGKLTGLFMWSVWVTVWVPPRKGNANVLSFSLKNSFQLHVCVCLHPYTYSDKYVKTR
jgi:hypothetical protein